jgi:hypothetical protein
MSTSTISECLIPVSVLRTTPFNLEWGSSVYAKVVASNIYGDSLASSVGNGAIITINPDPPTDFIEEY